jgi:hypothetical protein
MEVTAAAAAATEGTRSRSWGKPIFVNGLEYQGADVFMVTPHDGVDCVVLFEYRDEQGGGYLQLPGGPCLDLHTSLEQTIARELYKASKQSIYISECNFGHMTSASSFVDYECDRERATGAGSILEAAGVAFQPQQLQYRRCFVALVPSINAEKFKENQIILEHLQSRRTTSRSKNDHDTERAGVLRLKKYMETHAMLRVPLQQLYNVMTQQAYAQICPSTGEPYRIAERVKVALREVIRMQRRMQPMYILPGGLPGDLSSGLPGDRRC